MAAINNIVMSATKSTSNDSVWKITVDYDAVFSDHERDTFQFRDGFRVLEEDPGGVLQEVSGVVGVSIFNPASLVVHRTMTATVSTEKLATESGPEELLVEVRLRNLDLNLLQTKNSKLLSFHPDL
jgi:hypothetical protein